MEKNEDASKKGSKLQRFNHIIALKGAPYEALLLAIALSLPANVLLPRALESCLRSEWSLCGIIVIIYALLLYATWQLASNIIHEMDKLLTPWKWLNRILEIVVILLFSPFGFIMVTWLGLKKHRPWAVLSFIVGLILFLYAQFVCMGYLALQPLPLFLSMCVSPLFVMAGVVSTGRLKFQQDIVKISFAIAAITGILRMTTDFPLVWQLTVAPARMEAQLADYRHKHGINIQPCDESLVNEYPLQRIIAITQARKEGPAGDPRLSYRHAGVQEQFAKLYDNPDELREAIISLSSVPPRPVARATEFNELPTINVPKALFEAGHFLLLEMMAKAQQSDLVKQDNAAVIHLRDWCLQQESSPFAKLHGHSLEAQRLNALARTLAQHRYTEAEWLELLGNEPDWRYFAACAYKMEADGKPAMPALFNDSFAFLETGGSARRFFIRWIGNSFYCGITLWMSGISSIAKRLSIYPAACEQRCLAQFINLSLNENSTMDNARKLDASHDIYQSPFFVKPGKLYYSMAYSIEDARRMAMISWKIMEYSHEHQGALPENLAQINEAPVSTLNNLLFVYDHGDIEILSENGNGFTTIRGFRLFIPDEQHASKPNWKKTSSLMEVSLE